MITKPYYTECEHKHMNLTVYQTDTIPQRKDLFQIPLTTVLCISWVGHILRPNMAPQGQGMHPMSKEGTRLALGEEGGCGLG